MYILCSMGQEENTALEGENERLREELEGVNEQWKILEGKVCCLQEEVESKDRWNRRVS